MNFELIDNFMQVGVMLVAAVADIIFWFRQKDRIYIILALEHGCFMMGTLYYVLYLFIRGVVPQIFYVAEISWISSYLFLHTYQIVRRDGEKSRFAPVPAVCAAVIFIVAMRSEIFGPAILSTGAFAVTVGAITYIAVFHMQYGGDIADKPGDKAEEQVPGQQDPGVQRGDDGVVIAVGVLQHLTAEKVHGELVQNALREFGGQFFHSGHAS